MRTYSDEHITFWAKIYHANHLTGRGIRFDTFLEYPHDILLGVLSDNQDNAPDVRPLLPTQVKVMHKAHYQALLQELEEEMQQEHKGLPLQQHGDRFMTHTHKRDEPKKWKTRTSNTGGRS